MKGEKQGGRGQIKKAERAVSRTPPKPPWESRPVESISLSPRHVLMLKIKCQKKDAEKPETRAMGQLKKE